ncbi:MAG: tetratricopeptide repeat protein [Bacteroidota bacterium]
MKKILTCFLFVLFLIPQSLMAQQAVIDSLITFLKTAQEDTVKVNSLNLLSTQYTNTGSYEQALQCAQKAQQHAEKYNYQKGIAVSYHNIGTVNWYKGDYEKALENHSKALQIRQAIEDKQGTASSYNNIGLVYTNLGNYEKSMESFLKALKIRQEIGENQGIASTYNNIGNVYRSQGKTEKALDNYLKSLKIKEEIRMGSPNDIGNKKGLGNSYNNIGLVYTDQGDYMKSLDYYLKAIKIRLEIGDKQGVAYSYTNIGNIYYLQGKYEKALNSQMKSLKIDEEIGFKEGIAVVCANIGSVYMRQNKFEKTYYYFNRSLTLSKEIGYKAGLKVAYISLSELYEAQGDYKQSYNYHKLYSDIKDTLLNEQSSRQIAEMNTKYDSEKKDKELIKKDAEISKQQAETESQNLQRNAFITGFILVLALAFFILRSYRQKQNANNLLEEKNLLIENQKQLVEEKNLKITDSINYGKRIQQAILPSQELIKSLLPDSFIFFRPKDIVSGDFYWISEKDDKLLIAVVDCTGHGVPGAFMSMIGNTMLNEIVNVKNISEPDQILDQLNKGIVSILHQNNSETNTQDDGMDITILAIDKTNNEITFAGANHFAYLIKNNELKTLEGDVFSIGGMFGKEDIKFSNQKIKIEKGNTFYLFTDGFADQFGGEKNTKFLSSRFAELLQNIQQPDMEQQKEKLISAFDDWKGNNKQLDDVCVFGVKI